MLRILNKLKEMAKKIKWWNRNKNYIIFAKSFSRTTNEFKGKIVYCLDLKGIGKLLSKNSITAKTINHSP